MGPRLRTVAIKQLPRTEREEEVSAFLQELDTCLRMDRPRIVLNCSGVRMLGRPDLHLLLCCLEEAMKRNGDVRLSSVPEPALAVLESTGIGRLFRIFDNDADAVASFQRLPMAAMLQSKPSSVEAPFEIRSAEALFETAADEVYGPAARNEWPSAEAGNPVWK